MATRIAEGAVPEDCILELYGIYKQATKGDCDVKVRPTRLDIKGYAKFTEWMKHKGMTESGRVQDVREFLESRLDDLELLPSPKKKSNTTNGGGGGGAFGRSQSTMRRLEERMGKKKSGKRKRACLKPRRRVILISC